MSDPRRRGLLWSLALIVGGVLLLLFNFGVLADFAPWPQVLLGAGGFAAAGYFFFGFMRNSRDWWRLIPAWTLAALTGMILLTLAPAVDPQLVAAVLFVGLAMAFVHVYLLDRSERWWALIPGGFLLVLGAVIALSGRIAQLDLLATVLFVGLGAVFFLLYWLDSQRRQWWAVVPGGVLVIFGVLALAAGHADANPLLRWWPLALIVAGALVAFWSARRVPAPAFTVQSAPKVSTNSSPSGRAGVLGDYSTPAPGASIEILPDSDEVKKQPRR